MTLAISSVTIREVGVREGLQNFSKVLSTSQKLHLIKLLSNTGIKEIEVTSFVRPDKVPQLADAEALVNLLPEVTGVSYSGLYLNQKGFMRAEAAGRLATEAWIPLALSDSFLRKNNNISLEESLRLIPSWEELFRRFRKNDLKLMMSTCFGSNEEGLFKLKHIISCIEQACGFLTQMPTEICLADTMGWGNPKIVQSVVKELKNQLPMTIISLHLHDTRGLGIANAYAGFIEGVTVFDSSIGGIGGCPFVPNASGNIATEELVNLFESMEISTGINLEKLRDAYTWVVNNPGIPTFGKYFRSHDVSHRYSS